MEFSEFENEFLLQLKAKKNKCLELIDMNKKLIEENLGDHADLKKLDKFVDGINNIILVTENNIMKTNFKLFEKVLKHPYFNRVLSTFNNSDILVKACKVENKDVAKWLLSNMDVSPYIQDEDGVSALMYAAKCGFNFVIKPFFHDSQCMNLEDKYGNNVLFYAVQNPKLIPNEGVSNFATNLINSDVDINHINQKGETILTYCIKNDIFKPINLYLLRNVNIDVNVADNDGITPAMYLVRKGRYSEFVTLHRKNCNYEYIDANDQSVFSILLNKLYTPQKYRKGESYENYVRIMSALVNFQSNFNIPIDKDNNTTFMKILIVNDIYTIAFCTKYIKKLDLSVKNKYGESATSIIFKTKHYEIMKFIKDNPTFDYYYRDSINQNTLLMIAAINNSPVMRDLLENDPSIINEVNNKNENALIIASKINNVDSVRILLEKGINVNHQDNMGNTALHYAVEIQNPYLVYRLIDKNANIHIKNNDGRTALEIAKKLENKDVICALTNSSYKVDMTPSENKDSHSKYDEEIQKYLTPYITNEYSDFVSTPAMNSVKKEIYRRNTDINTKTDYAILGALLL